MKVRTGVEVIFAIAATMMLESRPPLRYAPSGTSRDQAAAHAPFESLGEAFEVFFIGTGKRAVKNLGRPIALSV